MFRRLCEALDAPELVADPRFATGRERLEHRPELTVEIEKHLASRHGGRVGASC